MPDSIHEMPPESPEREADPGTASIESNNSTDEPLLRQQRSENRWRKVRTYVAFWLFGLCNNFGYVVMLSAAHDIMKENRPQPHMEQPQAYMKLVYPSDPHPHTRSCNPTSVGAVLLADILPTILVKLAAPFFMQSVPYGVRVAVVIVCQAASYIVVAASTTVAVSLLGVVVGSFAAGLGELTFLAFTAHFNPTTISCWSSGTGAAGVLPALAYALLTEEGLVGMPPRRAILAMLLVPVLFAVAYSVLLTTPYTVSTVREALSRSTSAVGSETRRLLDEEPTDEGNLVATLTLVDKLHLIAPLIKYMLPLCVVYFAEYYINQGLLELILFEHIFLSSDSQYRWYQTIYQMGVFFSRSSVNCCSISTKLFPLLAMLQVINAIFLTFETIYLFLPSIWIIFLFIFYEGLLGGTAYVNTFYKIRTEVAPQFVEFSLGVASVADSLGITLAAFLALYVHNKICALVI